MKLMVLILMFITQNAFAGVTVKSCSGDIRYCDEFGICTDDYFYLYAFQVASVTNGQIKNVRSRFRMRGALGDAKDYELSFDLVDNKIIYTGLELDLAIPLQSDQSILYRNKKAQWQELCP